MKIKLSVLGDAFWKEYLMLLIDIKHVFKLHWGKFKIKSWGCKSNFLLEDAKRIIVNTILKSIRQENASKLVFAHLNINSIRNKFQLLVNQVKGNIDVLIISETKIDYGCPFGNFLIDGFSKQLYWLDCDALGGGI